MALLPIQRNAHDTRGQPDLTRLVDSWAAFTASFGDTFNSAANVIDNDDVYLVPLYLPETERDDIEVAIGDRRLAVTGFRTSKKGPLRQRSHRTDRFAYEFVFPRSVDEDQVTATLEGTSLTVRAPKLPTERRRRIDIQ